ncbi:hypothetical protein DESC_480203 [Desulfosarcina cetonica]|nr:hypothetical protein DESC_480203 [Desulfosarcina cetonica]
MGENGFQRAGLIYTSDETFDKELFSGGRDCRMLGDSDASDVKHGNTWAGGSLPITVDSAVYRMRKKG